MGTANVRKLAGPVVAALAIAVVGCAPRTMQQAGPGQPPEVAEPEPAPAAAVRERYALIPWPRQLQEREGEFVLDAGTRLLLAPEVGARIRSAAERWAQRVRRATGLALPVVARPATTNDAPANAVPTSVAPIARDAMAASRGPAYAAEPRANVILLALDPALDAGEPEGYRLEIAPARVTLAAAAEAGLFHGLETLRQLLPPWVEQGRGSSDGVTGTAPRSAAVEIAGTVAPAAGGPAESGEGADYALPAADAYGSAAGRELTVPAVEIHDAPRFRYRGMHLDVGRHFFPVDFIKRYIDLLALYKFNRFHWHLTDDQGWRLEIERYPRLTEVGACRAETQVARNTRNPYIGDGERYCGYYTQEQAREIVAYARARFVTVIPEIEMPGHSRAALAAYPELACTPGPFEVGTRWGIYEDIYCPSEQTFEFLEDVLTEVMDIFPSRYIHIGGDEAPKARWEASGTAQAVMASEELETEDELQSWFIERIGRFLAGHGRRIIGWDEILEGGLPEGATVMSWRGIEGGIAAARQGADVVMTPTSHLYFDYYQGDPDQEPLAIGGHTTLRDVYGFEPVPSALTPEQAEHILGAQANVWTEYLPSSEQVEYMAYPRALALAEVVWSPPQARHWQAFLDRVGPHLVRLDSLGVDYRLPDVMGLEDDSVMAGPDVTVPLDHPAAGAAIRFTLDGSEPTRESLLYTRPIELRLPPPVRVGPDSAWIGQVGITIKARAFLPDGRTTDVSSATFVRGPLTADPSRDLTSN